MGSNLDAVLLILVIGISVFLILATALLFVVVVFWLRELSAGKKADVPTSLEKNDYSSSKSSAKHIATAKTTAKKMPKSPSSQPATFDSSVSQKTVDNNAPKTGRDNTKSPLKDSEEKINQTPATSVNLHPIELRPPPRFDEQAKDSSLRHAAQDTKDKQSKPEQQGQQPKPTRPRKSRSSSQTAKKKSSRQSQKQTSPEKKSGPIRSKKPSGPETVAVKEQPPHQKTEENLVETSQWQNFEFTPESERAYDLMESPKSNCVFITGKAGTGKSMLLKYFKAHTTKEVVFLAPTGVAALNVGGQTIHSFFKFPPRTINRDEIKRVRHHRIYQRIDTIVIDEVSMVRVDMMDNIDRFLRLNGRDANRPFGGVQMIFFGDLYQLPPVVGSDEEESKFLSTHYQSPYFFDAKVFDELTVEMVELAKVYRQKDPKFLEVLNAVRVGKVDEEHISLINQRYLPEFIPPAAERYMILTPNNKLAAEINERELARLSSTSQKYVGVTTGDFKKLIKRLPTEIELVLKKDAQVMFVKNDMSGRWVNGTLGVIHNLDENEIHVEVVSTSDDQTYIYPVERENWDLIKYRFDHATGRIKAEIVASISQYPLKLAWAITIHKSQGMTLDNVIIDIGNGAFAHGQTYVALSRCRTFEGIRLKEELLITDIKVDSAIRRVKERFNH